MLGSGPTSPISENDLVTLYGNNFIPGEATGVAFDVGDVSYYVWDVTVLNSKTIIFYLPSYIPPGDYKVSVMTGPGFSDKSIFISVKAK